MAKSLDEILADIAGQSAGSQPAPTVQVASGSSSQAKSQSGF